MLKVKLHHHLPDFTLDVEFEAPKGVTVLFGASGSGKTSIANAVAGLFEPDAGEIRLGETLFYSSESGIFVSPEKRRIGYIFQEGRLFPHMNVEQNLKFGHWFAPKKAHFAEFGAIVELLGITHLLKRKPAALSGGEKQRVAIGRALLSEPELIIADEPLASLDDARKAEILPYFERLRDEFAVPMIYVTHSVIEMQHLGTTVVTLDKGRIAEVAPPRELG